MPNFYAMSDRQIMVELGQRFEALRRKKKTKVNSVVEISGTNRDALYKFKNGKGGITLETFIALMRGLDELDALERLLPEIEALVFEEPKSIRKPKTSPPNSGFQWGDDIE